MIEWKMRDLRTGPFSAGGIDADFNEKGRTFVNKIGVKGSLFHFVYGFGIDDDGVRRFHQRRSCDSIDDYEAVRFVDGEEASVVPGRHMFTRNQLLNKQDRILDDLADLRNFAKWDPSVEYSKLVSGTAPGPDAVYEVKVMAAVLRYKTAEYSEPTRVVAEAKTKLLYSYDVIEVTPTETGCEVLYDATFEMNGPVGAVVNPLVKLFFDRIGDKAAAGMETALEGTKAS